jgi:hypothetical protein
MIWVDTTDAGFTVEELIAELAKEKIKISGSGYAARVVLHYQISDETLEKFIDVLRSMASSPSMKAAIELTKTSMREDPASIYDEEDDSSSYTSARGFSPRRLTLVESEKHSRFSSSDELSTPIPRKSSFGDADTEVSCNSRSSSTVNQRCLFNESDEEQPKRIRRPLSSAHSSPSGFTLVEKKSRPVSAYEPVASKKFTETANENKSQEPVIRRAHSLDLTDTVQTQVTFEKEIKRSNDPKKASKLQYRLSHNPASKAFKRASVRIARWSSILAREP